jgi:hypothetical protein
MQHEMLNNTAADKRHFFIRWQRKRHIKATEKKKRKDEDRKTRGEWRRHDENMNRQAHHTPTKRKGAKGKWLING